MVNDFISIDHQNDGNFRDRLVIKGDVQGEDGSIIEDAINVMLDRLTGYFHLEIERISSSIYPEERKQQIRLVYDNLYQDMLRAT